MTNSAEARIEAFRKELGPFVVAAETTRMAMIFTDAQDNENPIAFANDSFLALTGFTRNEVLGRELSSILSNISDPLTCSSIQSALGEGGDGTWEMQCRRVDGSDFPASVFLSPVRDKAGVLRQNFLSFVPLGARFDRLLKQRNEFQALYEHAPGFIATTEGPDHCFTFANASFKRFFGRKPVEGQTVAEAFPETGAQGFIDLLDKVFHTGEPFEGTAVPFDFPDAATGLVERRYANFVYQPVCGASGAIIGLFCEGYDVSKQQEATENVALLQAELIHLSRVNAMGTMAITLAHELNQPLSAIANYTAGGLRLIDPSNRILQPVARALRAIDEAGQRASDIIRTLRELTDRREPAEAPFDLKLAVGECIRLVSASAPPNVEIVDLTPIDVTMAADRIQIQQVTINLLRNACDAVAASGRNRITISAAVRDGERVVSVADTGPGVSLKAAEDIFSWTHSLKEGGMGLGLSICRTIMETHRGRIWLEQSSDVGSEFCFSVPLKPSYVPALAA